MAPQRMAKSRHIAKHLFATLLMLFAILCLPPVHAQRLPEFLGSLKIAEIFPGADRLGPAEGKPMVARAYAGTRQLGYVYLTTDVVNTRGYSSKPIDTLVAIANSGEIVGARLVQHHEPIVLIGIPQAKVDAFINAYIGLNLIENPPRPGSPAPADIISGATVTVMVIGDSITRSVRVIARTYPLGKDAAISSGAQSPVENREIDPEINEIKSWDYLVESGAIGNLRLTVGDVNDTFKQTGRQGAIEHPERGDPSDPFIDMYAAVVSAPSIGRSLLGDTEWQHLRNRLKPGHHAVLIAGDGPYSFKGSGYVRGGIFDRIEVIQGDTSFRFTDLNHQRLPSIAAAGAPRFKEIALFAVPDDVQFDPVMPWRVQLMVQRVINVKEKAFVSFDLNYQLPKEYTRLDPATPMIAPPAALAPQSAMPATDAAAVVGEHIVSPSVATDMDEAPPLWKQIWRAKTGQVAAVLGALLLLIGVFFFQNQLTSRPVFYDRFRLAFLTFTLIWIGWYAQAQLSVVNVLTFTSALRSDFSWEYFLMDPVVFILWCATAISMVFWNRGAFCGWLCPFGALQELTNRIAKKFGVKQIRVHHGAHQRLSAIKYVIFIVLFGFSMYELALAERLAEIEPFKTAIILKFVRYWPFVLFAVLLLVAGLFIERFYCRYLCPLGAALAIPAKLRTFDWLRRYRTCGNPCQRCNIECPVQAINPEGDINPNECIQCLHCQMLYHHTEKCPHLIQKNSKRQRVKAPAAPPLSPQETVIRFIPKTPGNPAQPQADPAYTPSNTHL